VRGSGGAACDDGSSEAADAGEAGGNDPSDDRRRGSRDGPGQSQIDRCISPACGAADPPAVANAGVNPGSGGPEDAADTLGLLAATGGGGGDTAPVASAAMLISGSSLISISAAPSAAPSVASLDAASAGLPSWPRWNSREKMPIKPSDSDPIREITACE